MRTAVTRNNFVRNGAVFQRNREHLSASDLATFANRIGNFVALAQPHSHLSTLVSNNHQRAKAEAASTFHNLGRSIDENNLLGKFVATFAFAAFAIATGRTTPSGTATA